jgi:hypothetical protein
MPPHLTLTMALCLEDTRYTNPLKQKFKAKRLAAECTSHLKSPRLPHFLTTSLQPMSVLLLWQGDQLSRCQTNTYPQTRFFSCRIFQSRSQRTSSMRCSPSIPTYTKSVWFRRRRTSLSSNTWTKGVPPSQKMLYTITSWTERTRSR